MELLRDQAEHDHYQVFPRMTESYFAAFHAGDANAIGAMIDFYGGAGTFASRPTRSRSPAATQRANALLSQVIPGAALATIEDAAHFMIATHPEQVSRLIAEHVGRAEGPATQPALKAI